VPSLVPEPLLAAAVAVDPEGEGSVTDALAKLADDAANLASLPPTVAATILTQPALPNTTEALQIAFLSDLVDVCFDDLLLDGIRPPSLGFDGGKGVRLAPPRLLPPPLNNTAQTLIVHSSCSSDDGRVDVHASPLARLMRSLEQETRLSSAPEEPVGLLAALDESSKHAEAVTSAVDGICTQPSPEANAQPLPEADHLAALWSVTSTVEMRTALSLPAAALCTLAEVRLTASHGGVRVPPPSLLDLTPAAVEQGLAEEARALQLEATPQRVDAHASPLVQRLSAPEELVGYVNGFKSAIGCFCAPPSSEEANAPPLPEADHIATLWSVTNTVEMRTALSLPAAALGTLAEVHLTASRGGIRVPPPPLLDLTPTEAVEQELEAARAVEVGKAVKAPRAFGGRERRWPRRLGRRKKLSSGAHVGRDHVEGAHGQDTRPTPTSQALVLASAPVDSVDCDVTAAIEGSMDGRQHAALQRARNQVEMLTALMSSVDTIVSHSLPGATLVPLAESRLSAVQGGVRVPPPSLLDLTPREFTVELTESAHCPPTRPTTRTRPMRVAQLTRAQRVARAARRRPARHVGSANEVVKTLASPPPSPPDEFDDEDDGDGDAALGAGCSIPTAVALALRSELNRLTGSPGSHVETLGLMQRLVHAYHLRDESSYAVPVSASRAHRGIAANNERDDEVATLSEKAADAVLPLIVAIEVEPSLLSMVNARAPPTRGPESLRGPLADTMGRRQARLRVAVRNGRWLACFPRGCRLQSAAIAAHVEPGLDELHAHRDLTVVGAKHEELAAPMHAVDAAAVGDSATRDDMVVAATQDQEEESSINLAATEITPIAPSDELGVATALGLDSQSHVASAAAMTLDDVTDNESTLASEYGEGGQAVDELPTSRRLGYGSSPQDSDPPATTTAEEATQGALPGVLHRLRSPVSSVRSSPRDIAPAVSAAASFRQRERLASRGESASLYALNDDEATELPMAIEDDRFGNRQTGAHAMQPARDAAAPSQYVVPARPCTSHTSTMVTCAGAEGSPRQKLSTSSSGLSTPRAATAHPVTRLRTEAEVLQSMELMQSRLTRRQNDFQGLLRNNATFFATRARESVAAQQPPQGE